MKNCAECDGRGCRLETYADGSKAWGHYEAQDCPSCAGTGKQVERREPATDAV